MLRRYRFELILILLIICAVVATRFFPLLIIYPAFAFCCFYQLFIKMNHRAAIADPLPASHYPRDSLRRKMSGARRRHDMQ